MRDAAFPKVHYLPRRAMATVLIGASKGGYPVAAQPGHYQYGNFLFRSETHEMMLTPTTQEFP